MKIHNFAAKNMARTRKLKAVVTFNDNPFGPDGKLLPRYRTYFELYYFNNVEIQDDCKAIRLSSNLDIVTYDVYGSDGEFEEFTRQLSFGESESGIMSEDYFLERCPEVAPYLWGHKFTGEDQIEMIDRISPEVEVSGTDDSPLSFVDAVTGESATVPEENDKPVEVKYDVLECPYEDMGLDKDYTRIFLFR